MQLVSRTIFVVWPADDHISNIRESERTASTQHLAVTLIEPLPAKDRSGKQTLNVKLVSAVVIVSLTVLNILLDI